MKSHMLAALVGLVFGYQLASDPPVSEIIVSEEETPVKVIQVYYDATDSPMAKKEFVALFSHAVDKWDKCGVVFELTDDKKAPVDINWKNKVENVDNDALAAADYCGINSEKSEVTLLINNFRSLSDKAKVTTLVHELGHIICVDHSENKKSLMHDKLYENSGQAILNSDVAQCIENLPNHHKGN